MSSNVNFGPSRPNPGFGATRNGPQGPNDQGLEATLGAMPLVDQASFSNNGDGELPASYALLNARDQMAILHLPDAIQQQVLSGVPDDADAAQFQVAQNLLRAIQSLPGLNVDFQPAYAWSVSDAATLYSVLANISPSDRARLDGVTFNRVRGGAQVNDVNDPRLAPASANLAPRAGQGLIGNAAGSVANWLETHDLTASLGLDMKAWFPHALRETEARSIDVGDAPPDQMLGLLTHEVGHQVQFGPQLDLNAMKEWSKLSGWQNADGTPALGISDTGAVQSIDPSVRPTRTDNFVYNDFTGPIDPAEVADLAGDMEDSDVRQQFLGAVQTAPNLETAIQQTLGIDAKGYAMTSPLEDFAQSYRAYNLDPQTLVQQAPDKFLFINASSRKYTPDQVQALFQAAGQNPQTVVDQMMTRDGLEQSTMQNVFKVNGVSGNAQQLAAQAKAALGSAKRGQASAFQQAFMEIQSKVASRDLTFVNAFTKDPGKALGSLWSQMSGAEQAQFSDVDKRQAIVQQMQTGQMSYATGAAQGFQTIETRAIQAFAYQLVSSASFRQAMEADPQGTLASFPAAQNFPASLKAAFQDPQTVANLRPFCQTLDKLLSIGSFGGGHKLQRQVQQSIGAMNEESLSSAAAMLRQDPQTAAQVLAGVGAPAASTDGG